MRNHPVISLITAAVIILGGVGFMIGYHVYMIVAGE